VRLRLKHPLPRVEQSSGETDTGGPLVAGSPVSHRDFLKLAGAALGAAVVARLAAPAQQVRAGPSDTYLTGVLYGPAGAVMQEVSPYQQSSPTAEVFQFFVQKPNGSGGYDQTEALGLQAAGNVVISEGYLHTNGNPIYLRANANDFNDYIKWDYGTDTVGVFGWNGVQLGRGRIVDELAARPAREHRGLDLQSPGRPRRRGDCDGDQPRPVGRTG